MQSGYRRGKKGRRNERTRPKGPDNSELIGDVDLTNKDVQIYLVKMPEFLFNLFERNKGETIGRLRIPESHTNVSLPPEEREKPRIFIDKQPSASDASLRSKEFDLAFVSKNDSLDMMVFSANADGEVDGVRLEGTVSHQCHARPKLDAAYHSVSKTRSMKANTSTREIKTMNESERKAADRAAFKPTALTETAKQREERKKLKEDSRRHLDMPDEEWRKAARLALFRCFEVKAHYTADELAKDMGEATTRIRSLLGEFCAYNKSGPFSGRYELKDEFKTVSQRQQKARDLEGHRMAQQEQARKKREERTEREKLEASVKRQRIS